MNSTAEQIGLLARAALEQEARLSPKPGLVDAENCGAHKDMDLALLLQSAAALESYFIAFAAQGMADAALSPDGRISTLREQGREAEHAMFAATSGVNTHKGALFLLGVLSYVAGHCIANGRNTPQDICAAAARFCDGVTAELGESAGRAYARYGARGARGEAEDGFPHALAALEASSRAVEQGASEDDAWKIALLRLIESLDDANVLARCGEETAQILRKKAGEIAARYPSGGVALNEEMRLLDRDCTAWHASPGGAADVLACAMFLQNIANRTA
ncbi:MAG: triphosphoribosyl-dephospho-CoA synthase [Eubacteriales bacterium]